MDATMVGSVMAEAHYCEGCREAYFTFDLCGEH